MQEANYVKVYHNSIGARYPLWLSCGYSAVASIYYIIDYHAADQVSDTEYTFILHTTKHPLYAFPGADCNGIHLYPGAKSMGMRRFAKFPGLRPDSVEWAIYRQMCARREAKQDKIIFSPKHMVGGSQNTAVVPNTEKPLWNIEYSRGLWRIYLLPSKTSL